MAGFATSLDVKNMSILVFTPTLLNPKHSEPQQSFF